MCKAISEGGQRCFGHARDAWLKTRQVANALHANGASNAEQVAADFQMDQAEADLASTGKGREFLIRQLVSEQQWLASDADRLIESVQIGMVLQDIHRERASVAAQNQQDRDGARERVAHRAKVAAGSLLRAAKVNALVPVAAVPAYVAATNPAPEAFMSTGLTLVAVGVHAFWQRGRTAPVNRRTAEDQDRYREALERVRRDHAGHRSGFVKAADEILGHLDGVEPRSDADVMLASVRQSQQRTRPLTRTAA